MWLTIAINNQVLFLFGERYGFENRPRGHGTFDRKPTASGSRFVLKHRSFAQSCSARGRENAWCRSAVSPVLRLAAAIVVFLRFFVFPVQNSDCRVGVRSSRGSLARHRRRENQTSYDRRSFEMRKSHARNDNTIRRHTVRIFFFFLFLSVSSSRRRRNRRLRKRARRP